MRIPYDAVSVATMLRDYIDPEYVSDEHKRLCDIADSLYNLPIPVDKWNDNPEYNYKALYYEYGEEYWQKVLQDMSAIDSQLDTYNVDDLEDDYHYIKQELKKLLGVK